MGRQGGGGVEVIAQARMVGQGGQGKDEQREAFRGSESGWFSGGCRIGAALFGVVWSTWPSLNSPTYMLPLAYV